MDFYNLQVQVYWPVCVFGSALPFIIPSSNILFGLQNDWPKLFTQ